MSQQTKRFMDLFRSRQSACAFGVPNPSKDKVKADGTVKAGMDYRTEQRPFNEQDVKAHFEGRQSIVAIPLLDDGACRWVDGATCRWAALDIDEKCPKPPSGKWLSWFPSKSGGWHGFVFFAALQPADRVRYWMADLAEVIGHKGCEIFPKQVMAASGNGLNLPFFGAGYKAFDDYMPDFFDGVLPDPPPEEPRHEGSDEEGYWSNDALLAMLAFYSECVPGFEYRPCRNGWSVPCPGYDEGWDDGAKHSANQFPRISHESLVFLKNGWPKFRCVHSHCDGIKTFNMWREHYDPLRLWTFDEWVENELAKRGDYVK